MNRKQLVEKKFPEHYEQALAVTDPSGDKNKYLLWIAQQLEKKHDISDIEATIRYFDGNAKRFPQKDIYKYKDLKDVENLIKDMGLSNRKSKEKDKENSKKIYEDDNLLVVRVDDKASMIAYGANTKWCTTMKDQTYYEDYIRNGNDFYIIIVKNNEVIKSSKYAIARRGLLEFQAFDDKDVHARSFSEKEISILSNAVQAIVADKPPKNVINLILDSEFPEKETIKWIETQSKVTKNWIYDLKPGIKYYSKPFNEIYNTFVNIDNSYQMRTEISHIKYDLILKIAKKINSQKISRQKSIELYYIKDLLINRLKDEDVNIFAKDDDLRIRYKVAEKTSKPLEMINDRSIRIFKIAAAHLSIDELSDLLKKHKKGRRRQAIYEVIAEMLDHKKVLNFIINQDFDTIKSLVLDMKL